MSPLLDKHEAAKVTRCLFPYSSGELPTFAGFPGLGGTEVKEMVLKFTLPSGQLFQSLANQLIKHCCFRLWRGDSWQSPVKNRRWLGNGRGKTTDRMTQPDPIGYIGILRFSKVHFISLHFYKRAVKQYVSSLTKRNLKGIFLTKKGENSVQHLFCSGSTSPATGSVHHSSKSGPARLLRLELHPASQPQAAIALNCACEHLRFILTCFLYLLARCVLR